MVYHEKSLLAALGLDESLVSVTMSGMATGHDMFALARDCMPWTHEFNSRIAIAEVQSKCVASALSRLQTSKTSLADSMIPVVKKNCAALSCSILWRRLWTSYNYASSI